MMTNLFLNNCQFSSRSAEYVSLAIMFLQYRIRTAILPSYYLLYTRSIPALYPLYTCSISAPYRLIYWALPLSVRATGGRPYCITIRVNSSKFVKFLILNS